MTLAWTPSPSPIRIRPPGRVLLVGEPTPGDDALRRGLSPENQVVVASEAAEALGRLHRGETYDILLCELRMPTMDGIDLHRVLSTTHPDVADRIVFMTGEATTPRLEAFFRRVPNLLLEKPIHVDGVRALIERRVGSFARAASC
jgi:CheY-like chemotaxis protein